MNFLKQIEDIDPMNYHFNVTKFMRHNKVYTYKSFICGFRCFKLIENFPNLEFETWKNFFKNKKIDTMMYAMMTRRI